MTLLYNGYMIYRQNNNRNMSWYHHCLIFWCKKLSEWKVLPIYPFNNVIIIKAHNCRQFLWVPVPGQFGVREIYIIYPLGNVNTPEYVITRKNYPKRTLILSSPWRILKHPIVRLRLISEFVRSNHNFLLNWPDYIPSQN